MSAPYDDDELPPYIGARINDSLHRHFDEIFGPGYARPQPDAQQQEDANHD